MKQFMKENLPLCLLSLAIAFIIWISVINITNPIVNGYVSMPIKMDNESAILELNKTYTVLDSKTAKVNFKVAKDKLTSVRQSDFYAYVDLNDLANGNEYLPVHVKPLNDVDKNVSNINIQPSKLHVVINDISRTEVKVKYTMKGNFDEGHSLGNVILSPNVVYASGSGDALKTISHVSIEIPIKDNDETFSGVAKAKIITNDGLEYEADGLTLSTDEINYSVVVYTRASVTLNALIDGRPASGCTYTGAIVTPDTIMIDGPRSVVENMFTIDLPAINIEGLDKTTDFSYLTSNIVPAGLRCSSTDTVTVKVYINDKVGSQPIIDTEEVGPHIEEAIVEEIIE